MDGSGERLGKMPDAATYVTTASLADDRKIEESVPSSFRGMSNRYSNQNPPVHYRVTQRSGFTCSLAKPIPSLRLGWE